MALVLEYAGRGSDTHQDALTPVLVPILLTYAHLCLCWQITRLMLFAVCLHPNPHFFAWTPIAWVPSAAAAQLGGAGFGAVATFLMSVFAARMLQAVWKRHQKRTAAEWTRVVADWRVWVTAILWLGWVPVPALLSAAYQFGMWSVAGF